MNCASNNKKSITLTSHQQQAFDKILKFVNDAGSRVFILRGYAGTGKTTMVKLLIDEIVPLSTDHIKAMHVIGNSPH